ncbi:VWA domain-containing protein [Ancylobacter lacus]|uniref:VWA domain-containing protein n=1 Tax=Ancylobacter lacus TaxID=2579970 RepID=UPI003CCE8878
MDAFLRKIAITPSPISKSSSAARRLVFGLDATMSRQPTWDLACTLQAAMFEEAAALGGLEVQLVYYRGPSECRASRWTPDAIKLAALMGRVGCQGGPTQLARMIRHVEDEAARAPVGAFVFVGDAMEEGIDAVCAAAGQLALRGVPAFMFQEGSDSAVTTAYREVARLTGGAWARFDAGAAGELRNLLRAAAAYAAGGAEALTRLARQPGGAAAAGRLVASMRGGQ